MKYCKHLKRRKNKPYCNLLKKEITLSQCQECVNKEYRFPVKGKIESYKPKKEINSVYKLNTHQIRKCTKNKENSAFQEKKSPKLSNKVHKSKKRRITVSKEVYNTVIQRDNYSCRLIDNSPCDGWLELHHILYRSERKDLINDVDNCIMLCIKHHKLVHSNKKKWQPILIDMNIKKEL